jgi:siroheme synthase (precorrin-2 oxidase/ferrochelatase)
VTDLRIDDRAELDEEELATLQAAVVRQNTLQAAVRWALGSGFTLVNVLDQDEFTRDVIFEMSPEQYLVYDAT